MRGERNYKNGKIYKIYCNLTGLQYFGSTISTLAHRLGQHKPARMECLTPILDGGDYTISLVELYPCDSKDELFTRERWYIENNVCVNKRLPIRARKDWYEDTKDCRQKYSKEYYYNHKEAVIATVHAYAKNNAEKIKISTAAYRKANRETLRAKQKVKKHCDACGTDTCTSGWSSHCKSATHIRNSNKI